MSNSNTTPRISKLLLDLNTEATGLTNRLQGILDLQASLVLGESSSSSTGDGDDGGEQPKPRVSLRKTRHKLRNTMLELASVNDALADAYQGEFTKRERELKEIGVYKKQERRLKDHVKRILVQSKKAIQLKVVEKEEAELLVSFF